jgi:hypothetical protein
MKILHALQYQVSLAIDSVGMHRLKDDENKSIVADGRIGTILMICIVERRKTNICIPKEEHILLDTNTPKSNKPSKFLEKSLPNIRLSQR